MRCPFCKQIIGHQYFASSQHFVALYNISPILSGHSLVVSRRHVSDFFDLNSAELASLMPFARTVATFICRQFQGTGINMTVQNGAIAGQTVDHFHMHIIPRQDGDLPHPGDWYPVLRESFQQQRPVLTQTEHRQVVQHLQQQWVQYIDAD